MIPVPGGAAAQESRSRRLAQALGAMALVALALASGSLHAFEWTVAEPALALVVPGLPAMVLDAQTPAPGGALWAWAGAGADHSVVIVVTSAGTAAASPRTCAGSLLRALVSRPGMPDRDSIYRAPLDERTFLVLYILGAAPQRQLHAHLLSSAGDSRCVEARFTRALAGSEDEDNWRRAFAGARFEEHAR